MLVELLRIFHKNIQGIVVWRRQLVKYTPKSLKQFWPEPKLNNQQIRTDRIYPNWYIDHKMTLESSEILTTYLGNWKNVLQFLFSALYKCYRTHFRLFSNQPEVGQFDRLRCSLQVLLRCFPKITWMECFSNRWKFFQDFADVFCRTLFTKAVWRKTRSKDD